MKASSVPDLKTGQMITLAYFIGILLVLYIVYKILAGTGLIQTPAKKRAKAEQTAAKEMLTTDEYFDPTFFRTQAPFKSLGNNVANAYAQTIHDSIYGRVNTDYNLILSTFGKLYNKVNISELSYTYSIKYNLDLQSSLLNNLNGEHIASLMNVINGLPNKV